MTIRPVEAKGLAPIVDDESDPLTHVEGLEQCVEETTVLDEAIRTGATVRQLIRVAHTDQGGSDTAASSP